MRSHRSVLGDKVKVKSLFCGTFGGSRNTFVSMPMFGIETVGFSQIGPRRTLTAAGSGPPSPGVCASPGGAASKTRNRPAKMCRFKEEYKPLPNIGSFSARQQAGRTLREAPFAVRR